MYIFVTQNELQFKNRKKMSSKNTQTETLSEAFELLWNGGFVRKKNGVLIDITDILSREVLDSQTKEKSEKQVHEFLTNF